MAVLLPDGMVLVVDGRYGDQAAAQLADHGVEATVLVGRTQAELVALVASSVSSVARLGLEAEHISWAERDRLARALAPELVATTRLVEAERRTKDDGELARLAHAAAIASEALAEVFTMLDDGPTERAFALRTRRPHARPRRRGSELRDDRRCRAERGAAAPPTRRAADSPR